MSIRTSKVIDIKDRNRAAKYEGINDEVKRENHVRKAAGTTRSFTRGKARRAC